MSEEEYVHKIIKLSECSVYFESSDEDLLQECIEALAHVCFKYYRNKE